MASLRSLVSPLLLAVMLADHVAHAQTDAPTRPATPPGTAPVATPTARPTPGPAPAGSASPSAPMVTPSPGSPAGVATGAPATEATGVTLSEAVKTALAGGFDVLVAEAQARGAAGDRTIARALANPSLGVGYGQLLVEPPAGGRQCVSITLSDQQLVSDLVSGKRRLRVEVAEAALAMAQLNQAEARRQLRGLVQQQYVMAQTAQASVELARQAQQHATRMLELNQARYPKVIDEGQLARTLSAKLEADQAFDQAEQDRQTAMVALAFLMGRRGEGAASVRLADELTYRVPAPLVDAREDDLRQRAIAARPDLRMAMLDRQRAASAAQLARRQRVPDFELGLNYTQNGHGPYAAQPPTLMFTVTAPLPIFYRQRGEIQRAEADISARATLQEKALAQVTSDVAAAYASFLTQRRQVERYEGQQLQAARTARDITDAQYRAGAATLLDMLDAQRTFVATQRTYTQELASYWSAVFQLEQALGGEVTW